MWSDRPSGRGGSPGGRGAPFRIADRRLRRTRVAGIRPGTGGTTFTYNYDNQISGGGVPSGECRVLMEPLSGRDVLAQDTFTRTVSAGYGTNDDGQAWAHSATTNISTDGRRAVFTPTATTSLGRFGRLTYDPPSADYEVLFRWQSQQKNENGVAAALRDTLDNGNSAYLVGWSYGGSDAWQITRRVGGSGTDLALSASPPSPNPASNELWWVRARVVGTGATVNLYVKGWKDGTAEPTSWNVTFADTDPARITATGRAGLYFESSSSNNGSSTYVDQWQVLEPYFTAPTPSGGGVSSGAATTSYEAASGAVTYTAPTPSGGGVSSGAADVLDDLHVISTGGPAGITALRRPFASERRRFGGPPGLSLKGVTFTYLYGTQIVGGGGVSSGTADLSKTKDYVGSGGGVSSGSADVLKEKNYPPSGGGASSGAADIVVDLHVTSVSGPASAARGTHPLHLRRRRFGAPPGLSVKGFTFTYLYQSSGGGSSSGTEGIAREYAPAISGGGVSSGAAATSPARVFAYTGGGGGISSGTADLLKEKNYPPSGGGSSSGSADLAPNLNVISTGGIAGRTALRQQFPFRRRRFGAPPGLSVKATIFTYLYPVAPGNGGVSSGTADLIKEKVYPPSGGGVSSGSAESYRVPAPYVGSGGGVSSGVGDTAFTPLAVAASISGRASHPGGLHPLLMRRRRFGAPPGRSVTRQVWDYRALQVTYVYAASGGGVSGGVAGIARTWARDGAGGGVSSGTGTTSHTALYTYTPSGGGSSSGAATTTKTKNYPPSGGGTSTGGGGLSKTKNYPPSGGGVAVGVAALARTYARAGIGGGSSSGQAATQFVGGLVFDPNVTIGWRADAWGVTFTALPPADGIFAADTQGVVFTADAWSVTFTATALAAPDGVFTVEPWGVEFTAEMETVDFG